MASAFVLLVCGWLILCAASGARATETTEADVNAFLAWFNKRGGFVHPSVKIEDLNEMGRGLVATTQLETGETILKVPLSAVLNIEHAIISPLGPLLELAKFVPDTEALAIFLLWEINRGPRSPAAPYLQLLPRVTYTTLLQMEGDVEQHLQTSALVKHTFQIANDLRTMWEKVTSLVAASDILQKRLGLFFARTNFRDFILALNWVQSRQFLLAVKDKDGKWQDAKVMAPFADLINMANRVEDENVACATDDDSVYFVCVTTAPVSPYAQLLSTYGKWSDDNKTPSLRNWRLLLDYGFTVDDPLYDAVLLHFSSSPFTTSKSAKLDAESDLGKMFRSWVSWVSKDPMSQITSTTLPQSLLAWARLEGLEESVKHSEELARYLRNEPFLEGQALISHPYAQVEKRAQTSLLDFFNQWLSGYSTTWEQDEQMLQANKAPTQNHRFEAGRHMIRVRAGEKRVLGAWIKRFVANIKLFAKDEL